MYDYHDLNTTALWVKTLLDLDHLYDAIQIDDAGLSATDLNTASGTLASLRQDGPFSQTALEDLDCLEAIIADAIQRETLGFRSEFDGICDPEYGDIGQVIQVPIQSHKGKRAEILMQDLQSIKSMRDVLRARLDAELQMARLQAA